MSEQDSLVAPEGVDEGSADSTAEGPDSGERDGLLGEPPRGAPADDAQAAAPVDMESEQSRSSREQAPGQQLQEGEG